MDEYKRQVFERARAMLDRTDQNAFEHELWLESHRDPITGQIDWVKSKRDPNQHGNTERARN